MLLALVGLAHVADAGSRTPPRSIDVLSEVAASHEATVLHTFWSEAPAALGNRLPCLALRATSLGPKKMNQKWVARLRTALGSEEDWVEPDSIEGTRWLPAQRDPSAITIRLEGSPNTLVLRVLPAERLIAVLDREGLCGIFVLDERYEGIDALLREALPGDPALARLADDSRKTPETPPYGAIAVCDRSPEAIEKSPPLYPDFLREHGVDGTVVLGVLVDARGRGVETRVVRSVPELESAAVLAVEQWRFTPAMWRGEPLPAWIEVPVRFNLH